MKNSQPTLSHREKLISRKDCSVLIPTVSTSGEVKGLQAEKMPKTSKCHYQAPPSRLSPVDNRTGEVEMSAMSTLRPAVLHRAARASPLFYSEGRKRKTEKRNFFYYKGIKILKIYGKLTSILFKACLERWRSGSREADTAL